MKQYADRNILLFVHRNRHRDKDHDSEHIVERQPQVIERKENGNENRRAHVLLPVMGSQIAPEKQFLGNGADQHIEYAVKYAGGNQRSSGECLAIIRLYFS